MNRTMLVLLAALCTHAAILFSPTRSHGACPPPGSYSVTFNFGTTYFANHLDNPPLDFSTLPTPPGPVTVYKYTGIGFDPYVYDPDSGGWSPSVPLVNPGEGVVVDNPNMTPWLVNIVGPVTPVLPQFPPMGYHLRGAQRVGLGTFESIMGRPPGAFTTASVYRYDPTSGFNYLNYGYVVHHFVGGKWSPSAPILQVGESAFIRLGGTDNGSLLTAFSANGVSPAKGSDGDSTFVLRVTGTGFTPTDTITLQRVAGLGTLTVSPSVVDPCGFYTEGVFNLTSLANQNGYYHVIVTQGFNTTTVPSAFYLTRANGKLTVSIIGQNVMGVGMVGNYTLKIKNVGASTVNGVAIQMDGTSPSGLTYGGSTVPASNPLPGGAGFQQNGNSIPPGGSISYTFTITPNPSLLNQTAVINGKVLSPAIHATAVYFPILVLASADPNDKVGPVGVGGAAHYVDGLSPFDYQINFENKPSATAPARDVVLTDALDTTRLDLSTFELGPIVFGATVVTPPAGASAFTTDVPYDVDGDPNTPIDNIVVRVTAKLDTLLNSPTFGQVEWRFQSLEPNTLLPVQNVFSGFLPANQTAPDGQGSVSFSVQPFSNLPSGDAVTNGAIIVFDANAPIVTPTWTNTIDQTAPSSQVQALASSQPSPAFTVTWSGTDTESGIAGYDVFVSDNNGPYTLWLTNVQASSATYTGQSGHTYAFYSIATDLVGFAEAAPGVPDATTTVSELAPPLTLQIVPTPDGLQLLWNDAAASLESALSLGPEAVWTPQPGVSGVIVPLGNEAQFFRLVRP